VNEAVRRQIESLGTKLLMVVPGATKTGGIRAGSGKKCESQTKGRYERVDGRIVAMAAERGAHLRVLNLMAGGPGYVSNPVRGAGASDSVGA
jgi:hypothetical protein